MPTSKFLNPRNDLCFKRIFGTEKNKDILIHFLNDILARTHDPIENITFLPLSQIPEIAAQRVSLVDVMCRDIHGHRFIVEMQVVHEPSFVKRAQYYAAKAYIEQRGKGNDYKDLKQITFLAITDFVLFPDKSAYLSHHNILDAHTHDHDLKDFSFSFLELPKFEKSKNELETLVEKWAYFFKHANETNENDLNLIIGSDAIIKRAYDELNRYHWSEAELRYYDSVDMKRWSDHMILQGAIEQGEKKGREEGREEGRIEGEAKAKRGMVINMLDQGFDIALIANITKLTSDEILILKSKIDNVTL